MDEPWNGTTLSVLLVGCTLAGSLAQRGTRERWHMAQDLNEVGFFVASAMLILLLALVAGYGHTLMAGLIGGAIFVMLALLFLSPYLPKRLNIVQVVNAVWSTTWIAAVASFWLDNFTGKLRRLGADEAERMIPCA